MQQFFFILLKPFDDVDDDDEPCTFNKIFSTKINAYVYDWQQIKM